LIEAHLLVNSNQLFYSLCLFACVTSNGSTDRFTIKPCGPQTRSGMSASHRIKIFVIRTPLHYSQLFDESCEYSAPQSSSLIRFDAETAWWGYRTKATTLRKPTMGGPTNPLRAFEFYSIMANIR